MYGDSTLNIGHCSDVVIVGYTYGVRQALKDTYMIACTFTGILLFRILFSYPTATCDGLLLCYSDNESCHGSTVVELPSSINAQNYILCDLKKNLEDSPVQ